MARWGEGDSQLFACVDALWQLMYLHFLDIRYRRYSFGNWCICKTLIFTVADTLLGTNVSATCFSSNLQMLFSPPDMYNCICILLFLGFKDTSFANFASTSHIFDNLRMLLLEIMHLQPQKIHYRRYLPPISFAFYLLHGLSRYITYKKIDIRNSCEYGTSVGGT